MTELEKRDAPTKTAYDELQKVYEFFNARLFDGILPTCMITLQRKNKTFGYFHALKFEKLDKTENTDEIALNPAYFATHPPEEIFQTIVHEMAHLWQYRFGKPGRRGYHNKEWGDKMEEMGLMPSDTGQPGGKKTGEKMADYIIPGGRFENLCKELMQEVRITWGDRIEKKTPAPAGEDGTGEEGEGEDAGQEQESKSTRIKYQCPNCQTPKGKPIFAWGKPGLNLLCGQCHGTFIEAGK
ncbi:SprT-like domain-containing protein [Undibacterium sp. TS12]|uniref:SprT-like domain-containing protein n=1 Tax=Undibacterium sp. TS12 TaxID=2908202 RepID=UPI001F4CA2A6|nr:SprT-like domain-containing protein [Undibacterium sp. TS12]MCH8622950.1 SprT-like domain-containing protein [Undibacterium sp. TS12]